MPKINPSVNKIDAIKAVRTFTLETFGRTVGLKLAKDFVDSYNDEQNERREDALRVLRNALSQLGRSSAQAEEVLNFLDKGEA